MITILILITIMNYNYNYNYNFDVFHIFKKFQRFHSNAYIYDLEVYPSIWDTLYYSAWGQKRQHQLIFQQPPYIFIFQFCSVYWLYNKISAVLFFLVFVAMDKNFIYFQDDFTFCWVKWSVLCKYKVPWKPRKFSIFKCDFFSHIFLFPLQMLHFDFNYDALQLPKFNFELPKFNFEFEFGGNDHLSIL